MRGIIPGVYANGNSPVGGLVLLEGRAVEVEAAPGAVAHGGQGAAPHAVANLVRRAVEVGRSRTGIEQAGRNGRRHGHDDRPLRIEPFLARNAQQVELRTRQLADEFSKLVKGKACGDGGESTSTHG